MAHTLRVGHYHLNDDSARHTPVKLLFCKQYVSSKAIDSGGTMLIVVDERKVVRDGFISMFESTGVAVTGLSAADCRTWIDSVAQREIEAIDGFLLGECEGREELSRAIRARTKAALIALNEERSLENTLRLFEAGFDDVVRKPVHVRELIARIRAIQRRSASKTDCVEIGKLRIFMDGRDPEIDGRVVALPRRELRILEYLVANRGCRVSKSQIFNSVYGLFRDDIDENVVESHISKLRKRLRQDLGFDPIESQRYLGYRLTMP